METISGFSEKAIADLALVEEAKKGNEKAFESLMNRYRDSIYFMLLKITNNPSDAEDLTIEAFSKAFRNIDSYTPKFAFSTWLFKIATNNCVDFIRKNQTLPTPCDTPNDNQDNAVVTLLSDLPDPEELLINRQRTEVLENVINQCLPTDEGTCHDRDPGALGMGAVYRHRGTAGRSVKPGLHAAVRRGVVVGRAVARPCRRGRGGGAAAARRRGGAASNSAPCRTGLTGLTTG
jgi:RNA polymerase sigma-70 factor (ECF subfamily)